MDAVTPMRRSRAVVGSAIIPPSKTESPSSQAIGAGGSKDFRWGGVSALSCRYVFDRAANSSILGDVVRSPRRAIFFPFSALGNRDGR